jgi:hypothetical protein
VILSTLIASVSLQFWLCASSKAQTPVSSPTNSNSKSSEPLSTVKEKIEITVLPQDIVVRGKHGLKIQVKNNTDRAVIFNGEEARAKQRQNEYRSMNVDQFDELFAESPAFSNRLRRNLSQTALAAVTVGGAQTVFDAMKNSKPVLRAYGRDEERRQEDQERFGQRILWPGDSSTGVVLFSAEEPLTEAVVSIPAASLFDANDKALVSGAQSTNSRIDAAGSN